MDRVPRGSPRLGFGAGFLLALLLPATPLLPSPATRAEEPAPAKPHPLEEVVVSPDGTGMFRTIDAALTGVNTGGRILLRPGRYRGSFLVDRDVTIEPAGDPKEVVVSGEKGAAFTVKSGASATLRKLTIVQVPGTDTGKTAVWVLKGSLLMEDCDLSGPGANGVVVRGEESRALLRRGRFHDLRVAAGADGKGRLEMEGCRVAKIEANGVEVMEKSEAVLRDVALLEGKGCGVLAEEESVLTMEKCDVGKFAHGLVQGTKGARLVLKGGSLHDGRISGLIVIGASVEAEGTEFAANALSGALLGEGASAVLRRTVHRDNREAGVLLDKGGKATMEEAVVTGNGLSGVILQEKGEATILKCRITKNGECGVVSLGGGKGTVENCDLRGNGGGPWSVEKGATLTRKGNREK